jgi:hypothetical protein
MLTGMKEICKRLDVSESSALDLIINQGLPAKKNKKTDEFELKESDLKKWQSPPKRDKNSKTDK